MDFAKQISLFWVIFLLVVWWRARFVLFKSPVLETRILVWLASCFSHYISVANATNSVRFLALDMLGMLKSSAAI
jgi:hypothetical protein